MMKPSIRERVTTRLAVVGRARCWRGVVVTRDRTTKHDACLEPQAGKHLIEDNPTDIVEKHVDPIGTKSGKLSTDVFRLIVNDAVKAEFVFEPVAFGFAACGADHPAALDLGNLPGNRPGRARCSRNDKRFSGLGLTDVEHPEVGSGTSYPEQAEGEVWWHARRELRIGIKPAPSVAI